LYKDEYPGKIEGDLIELASSGDEGNSQFNTLKKTGLIYNNESNVET